MKRTYLLNEKSYTNNFKSNSESMTDANRNFLDHHDHPYPGCWFPENEGSEVKVTFRWVEGNFFD